MILKEVDGKHYVEPYPARPIYEDGVTSWPAVEDWTDAERAEWLRKSAPKNNRVKIYGSITGCQFPPPWEIYYWSLSNKSLKHLSSNEDFSQALTNAVIAVAKKVAE